MLHKPVIAGRWLSLVQYSIIYAIFGSRKVTRAQKSWQCSFKSRKRTVVTICEIFEVVRTVSHVLCLLELVNFAYDEFKAICCTCFEGWTENCCNLYEIRSEL